MITSSLFINHTFGDSNLKEPWSGDKSFKEYIESKLFKFFEVLHFDIYVLGQTLLPKT